MDHFQHRSCGHVGFAVKASRRWLCAIAIAFLGALAVPPTLAGATPVPVDPAMARIDLSGAAYLLEDPDGKLTLDEVRDSGNARRFKPGSPRIGYTTAAYWLRFTVTNTSAQAGVWWFDSGNRRLQEIDLFAPDREGVYQRQSASSTRPFADRPLPTADFVFPLVLAADAPVDLYLRVRSTTAPPVILNPMMWRPEAYQAHSTNDKTRWFYYLGIATALGLFNLMIYLLMRDANYLLYVLSLLSLVWAVSSTLTSVGPIFEYAWAEAPLFEQMSWTAPVPVFEFFFVWFVIRFLGWRQSMPRLCRLLYALGAWISLPWASLLVLTALQLPHYAGLMQKLLPVQAMSNMTLVLGMAYGLAVSAWRGNRSARFLLCGWLPMISIGIFSFLANVSGRENVHGSMLWTSVFEMAVMALALADRFRQEVRAKLGAQAELVATLQRSERELEAKVELRTAEVKAQAAQLDEWNHTLEHRVQAQVEQIEQLGRLKRFFSPQLAEVIVAGGEEALKTHRREVSVVFIDLRGFTAFTDRAEPEQVIEMLRAFHATMGGIVMEHHGTLERFAGDSLMVFFNDPVPMEGHAEQAVVMALEMQQAFVALGALWAQRGFKLGLGCGIALGEATLGEIGFDGRWDYAAIGSVTNLSARLCAEAAAGEVLVDGKVMDQVGNLVAGRPVGPLALKGLSQPVPAFALLGLKPGLSAS